MTESRKGPVILDDFAFGGRRLQYPEASKRSANYVIDYSVRLPFTALLSLMVAYLMSGPTPEDVFAKPEVTFGERVIGLGALLRRCRRLVRGWYVK